MTIDEYLEGRLKTLNFEYEATLHRRLISPKKKRANLFLIQGRVEEVEYMQRLLIVEREDLGSGIF